MQTHVRRGRAATHDALIDAGLRLFGEGGADGVSVDDIIRTAKVSKQTFYNHFEDRVDLLRIVRASVRAHCKRSIDRVNEGETDPARRMARGLCAYAVITFQDRLRGRFVARHLLDDLGTDSELNKGVTQDVADGLAQGRLSALVLETGVAFTLGITQALAARVLSCADQFSVIAVSQQFALLLLRGFGVPHGEAEIVAGQAADQVVRLGLLPGSAASQSRPAA